MCRCAPTSSTSLFGVRSWRYKLEAGVGVGGKSWRHELELEVEAGVGGTSWSWRYELESGLYLSIIALCAKANWTAGWNWRRSRDLLDEIFHPPFSCFTSPSTESSRRSRAPMRFTSSSLFSNISRKTLVTHYPCHRPSKGILCKFCTKLLLFKSIAHYSPP